MSYDSEALLALRKSVEQRVEYAQLSERWDEHSIALLTPYLLFHVLDELKSMHEALMAASEVQHGRR